MKISARTDKGRKRTNNEDTYLVDPDVGVMIVSDGMGGHASGEVASQLATKLCFEQLKRALRTGHVPVFHHVEKKPHLDPRTLLLGDCIKFSNQAVFEAGQGAEQHKHMGTTMVAALWLDQKLAVAHVGDSRLYVLRNGDLTQCTTDHSFVQEQIDKGMMKAEDAPQSDYKNMLTRSVGVMEDVEVDLKEIDLAENDFILICSDGLTKMLNEEKIAEQFKASQDPQVIADQLVNQANQAGGDDNITVVVARVEGAPTSWNSLADRVKIMFSKNKKKA